MGTGYSDQFTAPSGLAPAWAKVRGDILEANGLSRDKPNVRVSPGSIVLDMKMPGSWVPLTADGMDEYRWRLRMNVKTGEPNTYRLRSAGVPR